MLATLSDRPFDDPDWLFEIKWDGYRVQAIVQDGTVKTLHPERPRRRDLLPAAPPAGRELDRRGGGHPRRRGRRARRRRPAGLLAAPGADLAGHRRTGAGHPRTGEPGVGGRVGRGGRRRRRRGPGAARLPGLRPPPPRRAVAAPGPARGAQAAAPERSLPTDRPVRFAAHVVGEGIAFYRAAPAQGLEGIVAKHPPVALRARAADAGLAQAQAPARAGARRRRLDAGRGQREGARRARRRGHGRRTGSGSPARSDRASTRAARRILRERLDALAADAPPFDPPPAARPDLRGARWIEPRAGHPGRARWLDAATGSCGSRRSRGSTTGATRRRSSARRRWRAQRQRRRSSRELALADRLRTPAATTCPCRETVGQAGPTRAWPTTPGTARRSRAASARVGARDGGRADRARPARQGRHVDGRRRRAEADEPRQGAVPAGRRPAGRRPVTSASSSAYFGRIAPAMLPHLDERPLNLQRFPDGASAKGFWQKDIPATAPDLAASLARGRRRGARAPTPTSWPTGRRRCAGWATRRRSRSMPGRAG